MWLFIRWRSERVVLDAVQRCDGNHRVGFDGAPVDGAPFDGAPVDGADVDGAHVGGAHVDGA